MSSLRIGLVAPDDPLLTCNLCQWCDGWVNALPCSPMLSRLRDRRCISRSWSRSQAEGGGAGDAEARALPAGVAAKRRVSSFSHARGEGTAGMHERKSMRAALDREALDQLAVGEAGDERGHIGARDIQHATDLALCHVGVGVDDQHHAGFRGALCARHPVLHGPLVQRPHVRPRDLQTAGSGSADWQLIERTMSCQPGIRVSSLQCLHQHLHQLAAFRRRPTACQLRDELVGAGQYDAILLHATQGDVVGHPGG